MVEAPALRAARAQFAALGAALQAQGLSFRAPPPEPTTCCGKGCHGCVWEGFYAAAAGWIEDAQHLLQDSSGAAS